MLDLVDELLDDPTLPDTVAVLQSRLSDERLRREQFYHDIRDDQKAEFINGEVIVHSPARDRHLAVRDNLHELLRNYVRRQRLGIVRGEKALCVFPRNDYEPDVCFFDLAKAASIEPKTLKFPVPDFIAEVVSETTEARDRGVKLKDYAAHGVAEYWLIDPDAEMVEQYVAHGSTYELQLKSGSGDVASTVIEGFRIPIRALLDEQENLRVLRSVLGSS